MIRPVAGPARRSDARGAILCALAVFALLASSCASTVNPRAAALAASGGPAPGVGELLDRFGVPSYSSSVPVPYFTSAAWRDRMLELIEGAEDYILVTTFLGNNDEYSAPLHEALKRKAAQGVRVYMVVDSTSFVQFLPDWRTVPESIVGTYRGSAVRVTDYNTMAGDRFFHLPFFFDREHRKNWIVDGKWLFIGGNNLNYYSLAPFSRNGNIESMVELRSPGAMAAMVKSFCETWNTYSPERLDPASFRIHPAATPSSVWIAEQGVDGSFVMDDVFDAFVLGAERELWMLQAFTFVSRPVLDKVRSATRRGVRVHIVLSAYDLFVAHEKAAYYGIKELQDAGASVYILEVPEKAFLHYKLILADDRIASYGSPNLNFRSMRLSKETAIVVDEASTIQATVEDLRAMVVHARPVSREEALGYRNLEYFLGLMLMQLGG